MNKKEINLSPKIAEQSESSGHDQDIKTELSNIHTLIIQSKQISKKTHSNNQSIDAHQNYHLGLEATSDRRSTLKRPKIMDLNVNPEPEAEDQENEEI